MRRIALMVFRLFFKAIYYFSHIWWCSIHESISYEEGFRWCKKTTLAANKAGRVTIEAHGVENLPEKDGFIMFPNHQGLFDGLVFLESCPKVFSFVMKKEAANVILLKQVHVRAFPYRCNGSNHARRPAACNYYLFCIAHLF